MLLHELIASLFQILCAVLSNIEHAIQLPFNMTHPNLVWLSTILTAAQPPAFMLDFFILNSVSSNAFFYNKIVCLIVFFSSELQQIKPRNPCEENPIRTCSMTRWGGVYSTVLGYLVWLCIPLEDRGDDSVPELMD